MTELPRKPTIGLPARRRAVDLEGDNLVRNRPLDPERGAPLLVQAVVAGLELRVWLQGRSQLVSGWLLEHGGVLFRGFQVSRAEDLPELMGVLESRPMPYLYRSTPRTAVAPGVFTATEYPAAQSIPLHNEMSYTDQWPLLLAFMCLRPADRGGQTHLADSRLVLERLPDPVRERFEKAGVMYKRNFGHGLDLPWQNVFQTEDRREVERFCRRHRIEFQWLSDDCLQTRQVRPATMRHPVSGHRVWFNQAHLFHPSALEPAVEASLLESLGEERLPRNALYGDGEPIGRRALDEIRAAYRRNQITVQWRAKDVLLLDNMLLAHGRSGYSGKRTLLAAMANPQTDRSEDES